MTYQIPYDWKFNANIDDLKIPGLVTSDADGNISISGKLASDSNKISSDGSGNLTATSFIGDGSNLTGVLKNDNNDITGKVISFDGNGVELVLDTGSGTIGIGADKSASYVTLNTNGLSLKTSGNLILTSDTSIPSSLTDIGVTSEVRFDDTNGIIYRCVTGSTTSGSGKWNSYYSTLYKPITQGSNNISTGEVVFELPDGSIQTFTEGGYVSQKGSSSISISPTGISSPFFNVSLSSLLYNGTNGVFQYSGGISASWTGTYNGNLNVGNEFSYSSTDNTNSHSVITLMNNEVFQIASYGSTSSNSTYTTNTLPSFNLELHNDTSNPDVELYSTLMTSEGAVNSIQNSNGSYSPYITGLKTRNGNLGLYTKSTSPIIELVANNGISVYEPLVIYDSTSTKTNTITTDTSGNLTVSGNISVPSISINGTEFVPSNYANLSVINTFNTEQHFADGIFSDPDTGTTRDAKFGNKGIAVTGGIKTDTINVTGSSSFTGNTSFLVNSTVAIHNKLEFYDDVNGTQTTILQENENLSISTPTTGYVIVPKLQGDISTATVTSTSGTNTLNTIANLATSAMPLVGANITNDFNLTSSNKTLQLDKTGKLSFFDSSTSDNFGFDLQITSSEMTLDLIGETSLSVNSNSNTMFYIDQSSIVTNGILLSTCTLNNYESYFACVGNGVEITVENTSGISASQPLYGFAVSGSGISCYSCIDSHSFPKLMTISSSSLQVNVPLSLDSGKITTDGNGNLQCGNIKASTVSPTTLVVANSTYANLPTGTIGMTYLVTNACKPGEASGSGTGALCVYDGQNWMNVSTGTTVTI